MLVNIFNNSYLHLVFKLRCHYALITDTKIGACVFIIHQNWKTLMIETNRRHPQAAHHGHIVD